MRDTDVLQTYTLQLHGPQTYSFLWAAGLITHVRDAMKEAEENLNDLLPAGYSVRIREWDEADESWRSGLWRNTR